MRVTLLASPTRKGSLFFLIYGIDNMSKLQAETTPSVIVRGSRIGTGHKPVEYCFVLTCKAIFWTQDFMRPRITWTDRR